MLPNWRFAMHSENKSAAETVNPARNFLHSCARALVSKAEVSESSRDGGPRGRSMNGWATYGVDEGRLAAVLLEPRGAVIAAVVAAVVAAHVGMVISVEVTHGEATVAVLHSGDSRGGHGEGEDGDDVGELHFERVVLETWTGVTGSDVCDLLCSALLCLMAMLMRSSSSEVEGNDDLYRLSMSGVTPL